MYQSFDKGERNPFVKTKPLDIFLLFSIIYIEFNKSKIFLPIYISGS